jgi:hypothetical protein
MKRLPSYRAVLTPAPAVQTPANSPTPVIPGVKQLLTPYLKDVDSWAVHVFSGIPKREREKYKVKVYRLEETLVKEITAEPEV